MRTSERKRKSKSNSTNLVQLLQLTDLQKVRLWRRPMNLRSLNPRTSTRCLSIAPRRTMSSRNRILLKHKKLQKHKRPQNKKKNWLRKNQNLPNKRALRRKSNSKLTRTSKNWKRKLLKTLLSNPFQRIKFKRKRTDPLQLPKKLNQTPPKTPNL